MHITTHLLIANVLYKEFTAKMGLEIDYLSYVYGNIKPDVYPGDIDWPHFSHQSFDDLIQYCEHITSAPMSLKEFSKALGVVTHFICDYYCIYHTKPFRAKGVIRHMAYEHLLELTCIKRFILGELLVAEEVMCGNIKDTINERLAAYTIGAYSINKDIYYALSTASGVVRRLIELSEAQKVQMPAVEVA